MAITYPILAADAKGCPVSINVPLTDADLAGLKAGDAGTVASVAATVAGLVTAEQAAMATRETAKIAAQAMVEVTNLARRI